MVINGGLSSPDLYWNLESSGMVPGGVAAVRAKAKAASTKDTEHTFLAHGLNKQTMKTVYMLEKWKMMYTNGAQLRCIATLPNCWSVACVWQRCRIC